MALIGNTKTREHLRHLSQQDRLHHCLLFEGAQGVGKAATARWLAQLTNCEQAEDVCGSCWSCKQIAAGTHPDVIEVGLDPERTAPIISANQARTLISALTLRPYNAKRRFVIIDPADAMHPAAANALLKTLEEPPRETGFVLITGNVSQLLPTILSRSQRVRFSPVPRDELAGWLSSQGAEDPQGVAALADGSPGRALVLSQGGLEEWQAARTDLLATLDAPQADRFKYVEGLVKGPDRYHWLKKAQQMLDVLSSLLRDATVVASGGSLPLIHHDQEGIVQDWAHRMGFEGLARLSVAIDETQQDLQNYINARLAFDTLLAKVQAELR